MYKIIKETINSMGNRIESKEIGIFEDYDVNNLTKVINIYNTLYAIDGSSNTCRIRIEELPILSQKDLNNWCKTIIEHNVDIANKNIKYRNNAAIISAKRVNKDKVSLIKLLDMGDYLYPTLLDIKIVEVDGGFTLV